MGLSPEDWRRALAISGAQPETMNLFDSIDGDQLERMRREALLAEVDQDEMQRALGQFGAGPQARPAVAPAELERALMAANGAPDYDARAARGEFGSRELPGNPYEEAPPDMAITPEEIEQYERAQSAGPLASAAPLPQLRGARAERRAAIGDAYDPMADPSIRDDTRALIAAQGGIPDLGVMTQPGLVNTALAKTGSDYRVAEPERAPQPDQLAHMRDEARFATEVPIAKADSLQRQADLKGQEAARQREVTEQSRQNVEQRRQQMRGFEAQAIDRLNRITSLVDSPPQESRNAGRAIMGAILSVASHGRVSDGREAMAREMRANVERWKTEIAGNREAMDALLSMSKHQGNAAEFDAQLDQKLLEYEFGALNAALDQEKLRAQSTEQLHAAEQAQRTLIGGYVRSQLYTMPLPDLARAVQSGDVGEEGQKVFYERAEAETKLQKGDLDLQQGALGLRKGQQDLARGAQDLAKGPLEMERLQAEIDAKRAEAEQKRGAAAAAMPGARVAGGYEIADPQIWNNVTANTRGNFEKGIIAVPSLITQLNELRDLVREHGTETFPTVAKGQMQAKSAKILGSIKEAEQLGALDRGVTELVQRQIGDVTAWNAGFGNWIENADTRLDETAKIVAEGAQSRASALGLRPMTLKPDEVAPPATSSVTIRTPDGRVGTIPRENLEAALKIPGTKVID